MADWHIEGEYMETCNCAFICPCIGSNLAARPTEGDCKAAIAMRVDKGEKGSTSLDGIAFIILMHAPGPMDNGNIKVGLIVDEKANDDQVKAIGEIVSGTTGGPMALVAPLVGEFAGVEKRPIIFEVDGMNRSIKSRRAGRSGNHWGAKPVEGRRADLSGQHGSSGICPTRLSQCDTQPFQSIWN